MGDLKTYRARFTKQGKLAQDHNSKTAQMGVDISVADLLTTHKLNNIDTTSHFLNDLRNLPSAPQISEWLFGYAYVFFWHS